MNTDPNVKIYRDEGAFVQVETTVVPSAVVPGDSTIVHVTLQPNTTLKVHWNNEVDTTQLWITPPNGWSVASRFLTIPNPAGDVSRETRQFEFEIHADAEVQVGGIRFTSLCPVLCL